VEWAIANTNRMTDLLKRDKKNGDHDENEKEKKSELVEARIVSMQKPPCTKILKVKGKEEEFAKQVLKTKYIEARNETEAPVFVGTRVGIRCDRRKKWISGTVKRIHDVVSTNDEDVERKNVFFDGAWSKGRIVGDSLIWNSGTCDRVTRGPDYVEIMWEGRKCRGKLSENGDRLLWDDNDVWYRKHSEGAGAESKNERYDVVTDDGQEILKTRRESLRYAYDAVRVLRCVANDGEEFILTSRDSSPLRFVKFCSSDDDDYDDKSTIYGKNGKWYREKEGKEEEEENVSFRVPLGPGCWNGTSTYLLLNNDNKRESLLVPRGSRVTSFFPLDVSGALEVAVKFSFLQERNGTSISMSFVDATNPQNKITINAVKNTAEKKMKLSIGTIKRTISYEHLDVQLIVRADQGKISLLLDGKNVIEERIPSKHVLLELESSNTDTLIREVRVSGVTPDIVEHAVKRFGTRKYTYDICVLYNNARVRVEESNLISCKKLQRSILRGEICDAERPALTKLFPSGSRIEYELDGKWVAGLVLRHNSEDKNQIRRFGGSGGEFLQRRSRSSEKQAQEKGTFTVAFEKSLTKKTLPFCRLGKNRVRLEKHYVRLIGKDKTFELGSGLLYSLLSYVC